MNSWRDEASQQAQSDLDGLLNAVLPVVEQTLSRHGQFYPFGAVVSTEGEYSMAGAEPSDEEEAPSAQRMLTTLYAGMREDAERLRAAAFVINVTTEESDAVLVELEHVEGSAIDVLVTYTLSGGAEDGSSGSAAGDGEADGSSGSGAEELMTVEFDNPRAGQGEKRIWTGD